MSAHPTRRQVLIGGLVGWAAFVVGCGSSDEGRGDRAADGGLEGRVSDRAGASLRSVFADPPAVAALGAAVRSLDGAPTVEQSVELLGDLGAVAAPDGVVGVEDVAAFAGAVADAARDDHRAGRVVVFEGWPIARTRAALAVVLAA